MVQDCGVYAGRRSCQNVAMSFYLDVCPHCNNWFVFVLRREYTNMAIGLERHVSVWLTKHCSVHWALHRSSSLCLSLQLPSGCAHLIEPDATLPTHATAQLHASIDFFHPLLPHGLFGKSIITSIVWTSSCSNPDNFVLNSSQDPKVSNDFLCARLKYREMCMMLTCKTCRNFHLMQSCSDKNVILDLSIWLNVSAIAPIK